MVMRNNENKKHVYDFQKNELVNKTKYGGGNIFVIAKC